MAIKPLFDKVVIKAIETNEKTASGIVLPGAAKEKPQLATVVAEARWTARTWLCRSRSAIRCFTASTRAASLKSTAKKW